MSDRTAATDLASILKTVLDAAGALSALDDQIDQMIGMFKDEDGAIQAAVDAGDGAKADLNAAANALKALLAPVEGTSRHPTVGELLASREGMLARIATLDAAGPDAPDIVALGRTDAARLVALLGRAAVAADEPIEIAVHVDGGAVQGVTRTTQETRPAIVYVHDHDVDGHVEAVDGDLAIIRFDNSEDEHDVDECSLSLHHGDTWETASTDGHYWTSLRAEAARLDLAR